MALPRRARRSCESGAAAVEFALVVPLLLVLAFGIISFGFMLTFRQSLSQAATEGVRAAAVSLNDATRTTSAEAAVTDALSPNGVSCTSGRLRRGTTDVGTCVVSAPAACTGSTTALPATCVTVTLAYDYARNPLVPNLPGIGLLVPNTLEYAAVARVS